MSSFIYLFVFLKTMEKKRAKRDTEGEEGEVEEESLHKYNTVISMDSIARDLFEYRLISNSFFFLYVCVCVIAGLCSCKTRKLQVERNYDSYSS